MTASLTAAIAVWLLAAPASGGAVSPSQEVAPQSYEAVRTVDPIVLDGRGTEKTWTLAPKDDRFAERQPDLGAAPPVRTTVQVAYDDLALYVLIDCQSAPGSIRVRTLRRDNSGIFADDTVYVKLDPQHDRRSGYSFGVNAEGAQIDSLGLEDGREFVTQWDGVWGAEVVRRNDGYTVEFRIPFAILGLKKADDRVMGFEITRDEPRRNATYDWRLIVPPRSPMAASQFGELTGLRDISGQRAIEYTPYALLRTNFRNDFTVDPSRRPNVATGGDLRVQIGAGSYVEASLLTDFAQVEADEVQVARDRFPLFFPERRPFFVNGLEVFNFGRPGEAQLFFSRRVGLVNGQPIPILGGAKVYGRTGQLSYGVLQVQTLGSPDDPYRRLSETDPENVTVGRIRVQATRIFNLGMMMLGKHRFRGDHADHAAGGVDAQVIALDGALEWYGFLAGTWTERPDAPPATDAEGEVLEPGRPATSDIGSSASSSITYRGLYVRPYLSWLWSDRDFAPELGFYRRTAASRQETGVEFAPRPRILGLREITFGPRYALETDSAYRQRLSQSVSGSVSLNWKNGSNVGYSISHFVDRVQQPFSLYLYTIEAKQYQGFSQRVSFGTPERKAVGLEGGYEVVELFGGLVHQPDASITARIGKHFTFGASYTHLIGHFEDEDERFSFGYANGNLDVAITRNLAFDNLGRLDLSPTGQRFGLQSRLRWRFAPGSDVFVVYRWDQPLGLDPIGVPERVPFHELTVKMTYYLRSFIDR
jgi:hypothetical protein